MLKYRKDQFSVFEWIRKLNKGQISTGFTQWTRVQRSSFIESILLGFPLSPVYVYQRKSGNFAIVDGRERTKTLQGFVNDEFALCDLEFLNNENLEGLRFSELPTAQQTRIEDANFTVYVLPPSVESALVNSLVGRIHE